MRFELPDDKTLTFEMILPIRWGDMDAMGHVNNTVYFRYFENARLEYFRRLDWGAVTPPTGVGPIVATTQARFRHALTYPDTIAIGARLLDLGEDRFTLEHQIVSRRLGDTATQGQVLIVAYHYGENRKATLPAELVAKIRVLERNAASPG